MWEGIFVKIRWNGLLKSSQTPDISSTFSIIPWRAGVKHRSVLLNLFDPLHPFKKQFSAIHPNDDKSSHYRKLKLGDNDIACIL